MTSDTGQAPGPGPDDRLASRLRGFGPLGLVSILIIILADNPGIPLSALLVLAWARLSRTPWQALGFVRPQSWARTVVIGVLFGAAFKCLMKAIVMPLLGADPVNHAYHYLAGNRAAVPGFLYAIIVGAGFGEETVFRGYLFERLGKLFGGSSVARVTTVLITSLGFGLLHYSVQGVAGTEQATIAGLVYGTIFMLTRRIWMLMVAHVAFDLTAYAMIYWNLETGVAHWVFR